MKLINNNIVYFKVILIKESKNCGKIYQNLINIYELY